MSAEAFGLVLFAHTIITCLAFVAGLILGGRR